MLVSMRVFSWKHFGFVDFISSDDATTALEFFREKCRFEISGHRVENVFRFFFSSSVLRVVVLTGSCCVFVTLFGHEMLRNLRR